MYNNIKEFLNNKTWDDALIHELYLKYIKFRELKEDSEIFNNLVLLFNKKTDTEIQKECNGLILDKQTKNIVVSCQHDFESNQPEDNENFISAEYCEDGTVIRLYNYKGMWYTATNKCINGQYSYWSNTKTFNDMFWETFSHPKLDLSKLNPECTYLFTLLHKDNILVVKHFTNSLIYLGNINNVTNEVNNANDFELFSINPNIRLSEKITLNEDDLQDLDSVCNKYFNTTKRGIILKYTNNRIYKHDFKQFTFIQNIRGNEPFIRNRYLELLTDPQSLYILLVHYPEHKFTFSMVHHNLLVVSNEIYALYKRTHVKHSFTIKEDHLYYRTLKQLHAQYKNTQKPITKQDVYNKLCSYNVFLLRKLLKWVN